MNHNFKGRDFINLHDMNPDEWRYLLDLAATLKAEKKAGVDQRRFVGKNVCAFFEWGSTRTRCAFETSAHDLGLGFTYLTNSHMGSNETIEDAITVISSMYDAIVYRSLQPYGFLYNLAEIADIPVINAMGENDHPTQMLADALTMEEEWGGRFSCKHKKMAYVGNCNHTPVEYARLCALMGMDLYLFSPNMRQYQFDKKFMPEVQEMFKKFSPNNKIVETSDLSLLKGMDVLVTEWWSNTDDGTGRPLDPNKYESWMGHAKELLPYRLDSRLMEMTENPDCIAMHMLPSCHSAEHDLGRRLLRDAPDEESKKIIREGLEISDECFRKQWRTIFREAENRQHTIKAILAACLGL